MKAFDVTIVGAGVSGLYAAYLLKKKGFHIRLLEASHRYGGRVRSSQTPWGTVVEAGAEFIHGKSSVLSELVAHTQSKMFKIKRKDSFYFNQKLLSYKKSQSVPLLKKAFNQIDTIWQYKGEEQTLKSYLEKKKFYPLIKNILESFAGEYGTDTTKLGLKSLAFEERLWSSGEKNYKLNVPIITLFDEFYQFIKPDISFNTIVINIDYSKDKIVLRDKENNFFYTKKVILTIPLTCFKNELIHFNPLLSKEKLKAIKVIGMDGGGIKVFLKFKKCFWKKKINTIYGGTLCPEYYSYYDNQGKITDILVGYIMGKKAIQLSNYSHEQKEIKLINELDKLFGNAKASKNFQESFISDWGKFPFINGAYSYASPYSIDQRKILANPIAKKIYFAGEAVNLNGHFATIHGAMETAERVVEEIGEIEKFNS